jgi:adenylate kinase family enzyme
MLVTMKIMIFGDVASGKSTFADRLGVIIGAPVTHLDIAMRDLGREQKGAIREFIAEVAAKENWVIDGNAFTKDKHVRIAAADNIIVFRFSRLGTLWHWQQRYWRTKFGKGQADFGHSERLKLTYYLPYILVHFPKRREEAIARVREAGKPLVIFRNRKEAERWLQAKQVSLKV